MKRKMILVTLVVVKAVYNKSKIKKQKRIIKFKQIQTNFRNNQRKMLKLAMKSIMIVILVKKV